jgi:hypothetical protein
MRNNPSSSGAFANFCFTLCFLLFSHGLCLADLAFNWETSTTSEPVCPNHPYGIFSCSSWGMVQVDSNSDDNGDPLEQIEHFSGSVMSSQQWSFEPTGDGYYIIQNCNNGKVIDGASDGSWWVGMWDYHGGPWQHWRIIPMGYAKYKFQNRHTGKYLSIGNWSSSLGMGIGQWDDGGWNDGQMFQLMFSLGDSDVGSRFMIRSKACADAGVPYVLDNLYANPFDWATVGQCAWWGGANQQWYFEPIANCDSVTIIRNGTSGSVLDANLGDFRVKLWSAYTGVQWHQWYFEHYSGPWFKIRNRYTGLLLSMSEWSTNPWSPSDQRATLMQFYDYNHPGELWELVEVY